MHVANTVAREHVRGLTPITAGPEPKISEDERNENDNEEAIEPSSRLIRKKRREQKRSNHIAALVTSLNSDSEFSASELPTSSTNTAPPASRKDRRKQNKLDRATALPTPPDSDIEILPATKPSNNPPRKNHVLQPTYTPVPPSMATKKTYPLLICSLGNPGATYANTLHSAGHTITSHIATVKSYRPFTKGLSGRVARKDNTAYTFGFTGFTKQQLPDATEDDWTFWQSTSLMNVSGTGVRRAWSEWSKPLVAQGLEPRLVLIHDELESALGNVSVKDGSASPRGHNGLKSCQASLGGAKWWRIGVGIGRPDSREPDVVSRFVLRKMNGAEVRAMDNASVGVVDALRVISEGRK